MTDRELIQQALDMMLAAIKSGDWKVDGACDPDYVLEALRARLAQPEIEDLGEIVPADEEQLKRIAKLVEPEREWQFISDDELKTLLAECNMDDRFSHRMVAAVVQKRLKEKNE